MLLLVRNPTSDRLLADIALELVPQLDELERIVAENTRIQGIPVFDNLLITLRKITPRLKTFQPRRETRFWNRVIRKGEHLIWIGAGREGADGSPVCEWHGKRTTASRVAWNLLNPADPLRSGERLRSICEELRCVAPGCHTRSTGRPRKTDRVTGTRYDKDGNLCCPQGHTYFNRYGQTMKTRPNYKGEPYCPTCRRNNELRKANSTSREASDFGARVLKPDYEDTPEGVPLLVPFQTPVAPKSSQTDIDAVLAMFDTPEV